MLAQRPKITEYKGQKVSYLQEKYNGMFVQIERDDGIKVYTRTTGVDLWEHLRFNHLAELIMSIPDKTSIFAELYWDGPATAVKTKLIMCSHELKLCAFAMPWWEGIDFSPQTLPYTMEVLNTQGWQIPTIAYLPREQRIFDVDKLKRLAMTRKIEGFVAKKSHMEGWYKIKPVKTIDCVVMSTNMSFAATTFGQVQSLNVGVYKNGNVLRLIARVGTGFSAEERAALKPSSVVGRVCEVAYQDIAQQGNLQFPRFIRWRDDKPAKECVL